MITNQLINKKEEVEDLKKTCEELERQRKEVEEMYLGFAFPDDPDEI